MDERLLTDQLFEKLSEAIVVGTFPSGSKLSEPRLAKQYGVSRGPLREAIRLLEERKLVTRTPRQGVKVITPSLQHALELFTIREVLEGLAAHQAALHATKAEVAELRALLIAHKAELDDPQTTFYRQETANSDLHFFIARIARNQLLFDLSCGEYYTLFRLYRRRHQLVPGRAQRALFEHERIVDAIADGDAQLAEILMRRHIASAREGLLAAQKQPAPVETARS